MSNREDQLEDLNPLRAPDGFPNPSELRIDRVLVRGTGDMTLTYDSAKGGKATTKVPLR